MECVTTVLLEFELNGGSYDFGLEAAAARREEGFKVSVRGVLPGACLGVHYEMVSES